MSVDRTRERNVMGNVKERSEKQLRCVYNSKHFKAILGRT